MILHKYQDKIVFQRPEDGYINLNQMATACGKRIDNWLANKATKELLTEFDRQQSDTWDSREHSNHFPALITVKGNFSDRTTFMDFLRDRSRCF